MLTIPGYKLGGLIYKSASSSIFKGKRESDSAAVIVKVPTSKYLSLDDVEKFKRDYQIGSQLNDANIIEYYGLETTDYGPAIITEDFGAIRLKDYIAADGLAVEDFLAIAIQLASGLAAIHAGSVVFKDIKPGNIVISPESKIAKYIDFGIATHLEQETQEAIGLRKLKGTLSYMSPEQTGRMNRSLDYRTDFYSLGISFYEMLTGRPPFEADDPIEIIHCHLAKPAIPPATTKPKIPIQVSNIIMKLLEKNAEDRYQSATGLHKDLLHCLNELKSKGAISSFDLGRSDASDRFHISQKLYGRKQELDRLLFAFERAGQGSGEMLLVTGYSGIGKSMLVNELHKPITHLGGYFISGKFEKLVKDKAYSGIAHAFEKLFTHLLGESDQQIALWREKLLSSLGANAQVIIDVVPGVEALIGKQPAVPELEPVESQNRFNLVFGNFVRTFADEGHPLVLFLDDLQWADSESLNLITILATDQELNYFMLIGSYRDNETQGAHPTMLCIAEIEAAKGKLERLVLTPLDIAHTNQLIADALNCALDRSLPLAISIFKKTEGNPFFLKLFLRSLYDEKLLSFAPDTGWQWDMEQISQMQATDNVAELMLRKLSRFPETARESLKLAACFGNRFTSEDLSMVSGKSNRQEVINLQPFISAGMILQGKNHFRFVHDRIQEAAYTLIPADQIEALHLQIGTLLLAKRSPEEADERICEIVDHYCRSKALIKDQGSLTALAHLNLRAGQKAKKNAAFSSSLSYFAEAITCLPESAWENHYEISYLLHKELAEAEYLNGNFKTSQQLIDVSLDKAKTPIEKADLYTLLIYQNTVKAEYRNGIASGRKAMEMLGFDLPQQNVKEALDAELAEARINLRGREVASLLDAAQMTSGLHKAAMKVMMNMQPTCYMADPELYNLIAVKMANISLKYGHVAESAKAYVTYANILSSVLGQYRLGYEFGILGLKMSDSYHDPVQKCRGIFITIAFLFHWNKPFKEAESLFNDGYQTGLECGDFQYAGYILGFGTTNLFSQGIRLDILQERLEKFMEFVQKAKHQMPMDAIQGYLMIIANLRGMTAHRNCFDDDQISETVFLSGCRSRNVIVAASYFLIAKAQTLYLYQQYEQALACITEAEKDLSFISGTSAMAEHNFYQSLILLALCDQDEAANTESLLKVEKLQLQLRIWAVNCEQNFLHKYLLVDAELARVEGRVIDAINGYDDAIESARVNGFIQSEALAFELAAKFWLSIGKVVFARHYLESAHQGYLYWGALAKARMLEETYLELKPHALKEYGGHTKINPFSKGKKSTTRSDTSETLDMVSMMKASSAISGEMVLDTLLGKVMRIVIENAGAQRGLFMLREDNRLMIVTEASIDNEKLYEMQAIPVENVMNASLPIIRYVERTRKNLMLSDACNDGPFIHDPYVLAQRPKSILCLPVMNSGQLIGILYLENNITAGVFTRHHLEMLTLLSSQAAISINNARLYANLEATTLKLSESHEKLAEYNQTLEQAVEFRTRQLRSQSEQVMLLNELSRQLQAAENLNEMHRQIDQAMPKIFQNTPGSIYLLENEQLGKWGHIASWGSLFTDAHDQSNPAENENKTTAYSVPLEIQNQAFGVLRLSLDNMPKESWDEELPNTVLEHISLAMMNLHLRNQLTYMAHHDPLTGLVNRRHMLSWLSDELKRCKRYQRQLCIIMFDVDHFKHFNDEYGHAAGDAVLVALGALLPQIVREVDLTCRYGGEEFLLLLPETDLNQAMVVAENIRESIAALKVSCEGIALRQVTCSMGVSCYPAHAGKEDELLKTADAALYNAKHAGRNQVMTAEK
ncbi:MAG: diguanylate cyclase [Methylobacter sp.]|nr:diguanylate cyclase [Methylobacter sp.]